MDIIFSSNFKLRLLFTTLLFLSSLNVAHSGESPKVSGNNELLNYYLGGGKVVPQPGSDMITNRVKARLQLGLSYSCGKFNFQENIAEMINNIKDKVRQIPLQLQAAVSGAVASLPSYLMMKINPSLYNTLNKTLDETTELFRLSYKTCEQIESEIQQNGPGYNPYSGFMKAVVANKYDVFGNSGGNIADATEEVQTNATGTIEWLGGNEYGTVLNPIQINHDLTIAGYNIMLGRTDDVSSDEPPTGAMKSQAIVKIWPLPSDAGIWIQEVIGDKIIITDEEGLKPETVSGKGLKPVVENLEPLIRDALNVAIDEYDFKDINKYAGLTVSAGIIDALRDMPIAQRIVYMGRLVSEMALNEVFERISLIRRMLLLGLNTPDNIAAKISAEAEQFVRKVTFPDMDDAMQEMINRNSLRQSTVNTTAIKILTQYRDKQLNGISEIPPGGTSTKPTNLIDGGVK